MRRVAHFELEDHAADAIVVGEGRTRQDVDPLVGQTIGDIAQQTRTVDALDLDTGEELWRGEDIEKNV